MSIVAALNTSNCQIWCCDGRIVSNTSNNIRILSNHEKKIGSIKKCNFTYGWVGEKFDAKFVINNFKTEYFSPNHFIDDVSLNCKRVNILSKTYFQSIDKKYCPTGFILGGYSNGKPFISIVDPLGNSKKLQIFASIGVGSTALCNYLESRRETLLDTHSAFDYLYNGLLDINDRYDEVGGKWFWFFQTKQRNMKLRCEKIDDPNVKDYINLSLLRFLKNH